MKVNFARHFGLYLWLFIIGIAVLLSESLVLVGQKSQRFLLLIMLVIFSCQIYFLVQPLLRYGITDMVMIENKIGWANPLGISDLLQVISKLPDGTLLYHVRWGHPDTAIQVFTANYPQLKLSGLPVDQKALRIIRDSSRVKHENLYLVFDLARVSDESFFTSLVNDKLWCGEKRYFPKIYKGQQLVDSQLVLCTVNVSAKQKYGYN